MSEVTVTTPTEREIVLTRRFDAPRHLLFEAWTRPELLIRWYGAEGWQLVVCQIDLRVGGAWRFVSQGPHGARMGQRGVYRLIVPPERLVYTEVFDDQSYPGESLISHRFDDEAGRTTLTSTLLFATREGRDTVLSYPMARGVGDGFDRLDNLLRNKEITR